jgi:hypothetical protein
MVEEARKKRTFFPEDIVDSDSLFHSCLLFQNVSLRAVHGRDGIVETISEWQSQLCREHEIASGRLRHQSQPNALAMTYVIKTKIPSSTSGTKKFLRGTTQFVNQSPVARRPV